MAQNISIAGAAYSAVPSIQVPKTSGSGNAVFVDTSDATAVAGDVISGKTAYVNGSKVTGTIVTFANQQVKISNIGNSYTLSNAYYTNLKVSIDPVEAEKIIPGNIKSGVTMFGVTGSASAGSGGLPATITAGDTPILNCFGCYIRQSSSLANSGLSLIIPRAGTWRIKWYASHDSGTCKSQLYLNGTAIGTQISGNGTKSLDQSFAAGDVVTLYVGGGSYSYYAQGSCLCACINWNIGL